MNLKVNFSLSSFSTYRLIVIILFTVGTALRLLLWWVNPPENAFDDHFTPIVMIMDSGHIPAKDACFECYHPPVFYWTSAVIGKAAFGWGLAFPSVIKLLQFLCCLYGILTVVVCYLILKKFPLSEFARLVAFGTVCFLPRHIYMCAMHSNDTITYLMATVSIYLAIVAFERRLAPKNLAALSIALTVTLFTKYTAFAIIPAVFAGFVFAYRWLGVSRKAILISTVATFVFPLCGLGVYMGNNVRHYHSPLPWNVTSYDPRVDRPRDKEAISFTSFKPWEEVDTLMLAPGHLHSFWSLIYSGMWFDTDPRFLDYLDASHTWWIRYYSWYKGSGPFPGKNPSLSPLTVLTGRGLLVLGLFPLALALAGFGLCVTGKWDMLFKATPAQSVSLMMFPVLLVFNAAGIIALTLRLPVYNSMKPSYLLNSTVSFMLFLALGILLCEKSKILKRTIYMTSGTLFTLAVAHILHIVAARF